MGWKKRSAILVMVCLLCLSLALAIEKSILADIKYTVKDFEVTGVGIEYISFGLVEEQYPEASSGGYKIRLLEGEKVIFTNSFTLPIPEPAPDALFYPIELSAVIDVPYFEDADFIVLSQGDAPIIKESIPNFCNSNARCDGSENYYSCPSDCSSNSKDGWCVAVAGDGCDYDCENDQDCKTFNFFILMIPILIIILILIILIITKKQHNPRK